MKATTVLRWVIYIGLAALLFTPLIVSGSMYFPFITGKAFFMRVIVEVIFGAWVVLALFDESARPKFSWIGVALLSLVGISLITSLTGINPGDSIWSNFERMIGWVTILHVGMLFFTAAHTLKPKHWRWLFYLSFAVSIPVGIIGLNEIPDPDVTRIDSNLGNPIYLAAYGLVHAFLAGFYLLRNIKFGVLSTNEDNPDFSFSDYVRVALVHSLLLTIIVIPIVSSYIVYPSLGFVLLLISGAFEKTRKSLKKFYSSAGWRLLIPLFSLIGLFNLIVMYFTQTRGAILGILVGLFVTCTLIAIFQRGRKWVRRVAAGGVVVALLVVGSFLAFKDSEFVQNQPVLDRFASISLEEGNAAARLDTWQIGLEGYAKNAKTATLGWGMGNYNYVFNEFYMPAMHDDVEWFDRAHNVLVEWLVAAGPLGLAAYLAIFAAAVYLIWRDPEEAENFSVLEKSFLTGLLVAYLVQNLFVFDHLVSYLLFALILGWLHARHTQGDEVWFPNWSIGLEGKVWVSMGVGIATIALGFFLNLPGFNQARTLIDAMRQAERQPEMALESFQEAIEYDAMGTQESREQLVQEAAEVAGSGNVPMELKQNYFQTAQAEIEDQIEEEPLDLRHNVFYGQLLMAYGQYEQAVEQYERANELANGQKQSILIDLARAHRAVGNPDQALEYYQTAHELAPRFEGPAAKYAAGAIYAGNIEQAKDIMEENFGTTTVARREVVRAYGQTENHDELIAIFERQNEENPNNPQSYVSLAAAYQHAGQDQQAIDLLEEAKERFSSTQASQFESVIEDIRAGESVGSF